MARADRLFDAFQRLHRADEFEGTASACRSCSASCSATAAASGPRPCPGRARASTSRSAGRPNPCQRQPRPGDSSPGLSSMSRHALNALNRASAAHTSITHRKPATNDSPTACLSADRRGLVDAARDREPGELVRVAPAAKPTLPATPECLARRLPSVASNRPRHHHPEDRDREQRRGARHGVVDARCHAGEIGAHRVHDGGGERRDGDGHAQPQHADRRKEREPVVAADARHARTRRSPRRRWRARPPAAAWRRTCRPACPAQRDSTNMMAMKGSSAAPAAVAP